MKRQLPMVRNLLIYLICTSIGYADEIDLEVQSGLMIKMLRNMANQTAADSLNLPANASSIRENITDTFSCENRTYGYYADVDNDCQIFHVCLPSQTASGRNVTYRWSFICPNETIFNQEVLVCTRPEDAIECKDSPSYYDLNKDIGKEPNKTRNIEEFNSENDIELDVPIKDQKEATSSDINKKTEQVFPSRNPNKRKPAKQNYIIQQLIKDIVDDEMKEKLQTIDTQYIDEVFPVVNDDEAKDIENRDRIVLTDVKGDYNESEKESFEREDERVVLERSMPRISGRGALRFIADV